jgi:hypothetical protein
MITWPWLTILQSIHEKEVSNINIDQKKNLHINSHDHHTLIEAS